MLIILFPFYLNDEQFGSQQGEGGEHQPAFETGDFQVNH